MFAVFHHQRLLSDGLKTEENSCQIIHSEIRTSNNPVKTIYCLPIGMKTYQKKDAFI